MKEKRLFVLTLFTVIFVLGVMAKPVTPAGAKKVAERFLELYATNGDLSVGDVLGYELSNGKTGYYFVKLMPVGWIMVSGDDVMKPVIGYSFRNKFIPLEQWEESAKNWMKSMDDHIIHSLEREKLERNTTWDEIFEESYVKAVKGTAVEPLIDVEWNQGSGWNRFCPEDEEGPGGHAYVGCVAVALAQAMTVHEYPVRPRGEHSYTADPYGILYINYDEEEPYDWAGMSNTSSDDENARLLYHAAVAINMGFGADGSGAYTSSSPSVLKKYFSYPPSVNYISRSSYTDVAWKAMIIDELIEGRPLVYSGNGDDGEAGHAFNVDGVGADGSYFHLNWGWSGNGNGYYTLDHLVPTYSNGTIIAGNFSFNGGAVFGMRPPISGPYDIELSTTTVFDMQPAGYYVADVEVADENEENTYTYELKGKFDPITKEYGPSAFYVENDSLKTNTILDSKNRREFLLIEVTDPEGKNYSESWYIDIEKYYFGPTDMSLSKNDVEENKVPGYFVGVIEVEDDIEANSYTYTCTGGFNPDALLDDDSFFVRHDSLFSNKMFFISEGLEYYLSVKLSDQHEHALTEVFELDIVDNISGKTGVEDQSYLAPTVYPNPASTHITLAFAEGYQVEDADMHIYNIMGQHCSAYKVGSGEMLDISELENGVYSLLIRSGEMVSRQKLVISK